MIVNMVRGDVLAAAPEHLCFAANIQGRNDDGFAGIVAEHHWPEIADLGACRLGSVRSRRSGRTTFHALVCHALGPGGWDGAPRAIENCLNSLPLPDGAEVAAVLMGAGPVGQKDGADVYDNLGAMARCRLRVTVYTL